MALLNALAHAADQGGPSAVDTSTNKKTTLRWFGLHQFFSRFVAGCGKRKTGRRDWTRTNDPHHVKVVL